MEADTGTFALFRSGGFAELDTFWQRLKRVEAAVDVLGTNPMPFVQEAVDSIREQIDAFEPAVSIIGQVKAGKSTLLNALIGETDLLPSDVNPWTSVITAIHLNSRRRPPKTRALFRFFDEMEWDRLVTTGGRLGEMADRAGFATEAETVRAQVMKMRKTTEERLGENFSKLLGTSHAFENIDKKIIDRYICYGDPDTGLDDGVYADITKLADLYIDIPRYPTGLCLRDTPGVNDTFMMREQITLNAISDSRVCVVVLSAHQALSTMDMALLRIICNVHAREVVIFVNRIDTLGDPASDTVEIKESIRRTLAKAGVSDKIDILVGSGYWANCAIDDACATMMPASRAALERWVDARPEELADPAMLRQVAFDASGVGDLHRAISTRIVEGPGQMLLDQLAAETENLSQMIDTVNRVAARRMDRDYMGGLDMERIVARQTAIGQEALARFDAAAADRRVQLAERLARAQESFVDTAVQALDAHLKTFGGAESWSFEAVSLRMMMRTAFLSVCGRLRKGAGQVMAEALKDFSDHLEMHFGIEGHDAEIELTPLPTPAAPSALARTLSLDLQTSWWRRFWRFGNRASPARRYEAAIRAEIAPLIDELMEEHYDPCAAVYRAALEKFLGEEGRFIDTIVGCIRERLDYVQTNDRRQEKVA
ncbi:MAG: dynamin family protein [Pseudooceanicola sp.]|nr:dynamin family protein [Pseudooceanicola sp.]